MKPLRFVIGWGCQRQLTLKTQIKTVYSVCRTDCERGFFISFDLMDWYWWRKKKHRSGERERAAWNPSRNIKASISLNVNLAKCRGGVKHLGSELSELWVPEQAAALHVLARTCKQTLPYKRYTSCNLQKRCCTWQFCEIDALCMSVIQ